MYCTDKINMVKKLSPKQKEALGRAVAEPSGKMYRWPGGYWTDLQVPPSSNLRVPEWWVGTQTMYALQHRGLMKTERVAKGYAIVMSITEAGREVLGPKVGDEYG